MMGIVSSKIRELEDEDGLMRRMEQAAAIVGRARPAAISPQWVRQRMIGNDTDEDVQWRKLELIGRVPESPLASLSAFRLE
jgi:hypothetical protein